MKKITQILILITFIIISNSVFSQSKFLYMPEHIKNAYDNGTRSFTGIPGKNYFQNYSTYNISAELNPKNRILTGTEEINYQNNSSDTLTQIVFNLYANIYKKGNIIDWSIGSIDLHDGVEISSLKIGNKKIDLKSEKITNENTTLIVELDENLLPKTNVNIEISWSYPLPSTVNIRQGTYFESSFFVGYWFPKIAVYDDLIGWNVDVYSGQTEFYSDYADYNVEITAPKNYIVWSSGLLQNAKDVLNKEYVDKLEDAKKSTYIKNIITKEDREKGEITINKDKLIWKFKATNISDFAFAMSDKYLWDATSYQIYDKWISINAVYYPENQSFNQVAFIAQNVIDKLSQTEIGIDFPFPQLTAFQGHYGMEYPMMVNDGDGTYEETVFVTAHEITHSYFPFYVGTNETKYAWMDEGLVTFLPKMIENEMIENNDSYAKIITSYNKYCGTSFDVPLMINSDQLSGFAYRFHAYSKSAMAIYMLKQTIGDVKFYKCLQEFIVRWNGKHPTPYDFIYTFESITGDDLSWFWKPWFFEFGYPDLKIANVEKIDDEYSIVEIRKEGNYPVPIKITTYYKDGYYDAIEIRASIWRNDRQVYYLEIGNTADIEKIVLGSDIIPDKNPENNTYTF